MRPDVPGIAQSITTTCGLSDAASFTASSPSLASPTTVTAGSSSNSRRNPRRTSVWSSARRTVILFAMCVLAFDWNSQPDERPSARRLEKLERATQHLRSFPHRNDPQAASIGSRGRSFAVVFYVQLDHVTLRAESHPCLCDPRVPGHVVQRLLHDAVDMNGRSRIHGNR